MQDHIQAMRHTLLREPTDTNVENLERLDAMLPKRRLLDGLLPANFRPPESLVPDQPTQVVPTPKPDAPKPVKSVLIR